MEGCKIRSTLIFLTFALMLKIGNALPVELHENEAPISTTESNKEVPDMSKSVKIQAEAIQTILTSETGADQDKSDRKNCDDIESSIKETLIKTPESENKQEAEKQDTDLETEASEISIRENDRKGDFEPASSVSDENLDEVVSEKSAVPNGRTLFSYYPVGRSPATEVKNVTTSTVTTVTEETRSFTERPNMIMIPCMKKIVVDDPQALSEEATRRLFVNPSQHIENQHVQINLSTDKPVQLATGKSEAPQAVVLDKIYSPSGQFLYYMYRMRNASPLKEIMTTVPPPTTTKETTTKSTTTTSTTSTSTTSKPIPEPVYSEQMKFVVRLPLPDPEPLARYPWKFDRFAYYPKDLRPAYVNAPVPYSPMYHMIKTLTIPNDDGQYVLKDPLNPTLENTK